jgi:iron complex outermembrane recepter protein
MRGRQGFRSCMSQAWQECPWGELPGALRRCLFAMLIVASLVIPTRAQNKSQDLSELSIDDLMNIQVTSVSKKEQKLSTVAAAIFVITQEDIRRSGATNIPDLLRMVPGLNVGQINGSTWAISSRGFNAQYSNKLLVMIDRRIVYTPNFAGVYWDTLDLPLEDIDRIEVIRGPGGSVWGANAVNGVISIFTKKAGDTSGGMVGSVGGTIEQGLGTAQYGGKLGKENDFRIYTKYLNRSHLLDLTGQNGADGWHMLRGGFRTDSTLSTKDTLTLEGDLYTAREGEFGFVLPSVTSPTLVPIAEEINMSGGFIQSDWNHTYSPRSDSSLQVSLTRYRRGDPLVPEIRDTLDLDYQHHIAWGNRQDIVWGLGYRYTADRFGGSLTVSYNPPSKGLQLFTSFLQEEFTLIPDRVYLTVGTKLEHNDYTGFEAMPSARLAWRPSTHHMVWVAVSRALRAPSRNDSNLVVSFGSFPAPDGTPTVLRLTANPYYKDEHLVAYEAGYRARLTGRVSVDLAAYFNSYKDVETTEPSTPFTESTPAPLHFVQPFTYENLMYGETHGIEIAANWMLTRRWTLSPGYALEQPHMHTSLMSQDTITPHFVENGAPRHSAQLRSHLDFGRGVAWDAFASFVDRLSHQGYSTQDMIPPYTRLDTSLTWSPRERVSVSVVGQNLLRDHHLEFEDVFGSMQSGQIKCSGYAKLTWHF